MLTSADSSFTSSFISIWFSSSAMIIKSARFQIQSSETKRKKHHLLSINWKTQQWIETNRKSDNYLVRKSDWETRKHTANPTFTWSLKEIGEQGRNPTMLYWSLLMIEEPVEVKSKMEVGKNRRRQQVANEAINRRCEAFESVEAVAGVEAVVAAGDANGGWTERKVKSSRCRGCWSCRRCRGSEQKRNWRNPLVAIGGWTSAVEKNGWSPMEDEGWRSPMEDEGRLWRKTGCEQKMKWTN